MVKDRETIREGDRQKSRPGDKETRRKGEARSDRLSRSSCLAASLSFCRWLLSWVITVSLFGAMGVASPGDDTPGPPARPAQPKSLAAPAHNAGQPAPT